MIQEFAHVRARRRNREDAVRLSNAYRTLFSPLLIVEEADLHAGLGLFQRHAELGSSDAVLAAAVLSIEATAFVSADSAFGAVEHLPHVLPDTAGIETVLKYGAWVGPSTHTECVRPPSTRMFCPVM